MHNKLIASFCSLLLSLQAVLFAMHDQPVVSATEFLYAVLSWREWKAAEEFGYIPNTEFKVVTGIKLYTQEQYDAFYQNWMHGVMDDGDDEPVKRPRRVIFKIEKRTAQTIGILMTSICANDVGTLYLIKSSGILFGLCTKIVLQADDFRLRLRRSLHRMLCTWKTRLMTASKDV